MLELALNWSACLLDVLNVSHWLQLVNEFLRVLVAELALQVDFNLVQLFWSEHGFKFVLQILELAAIELAGMIHKIMVI